jgi:hypothetical protein
MGLDIYLYKYENKAETDRLEKEYETTSEANLNELGLNNLGSDEINKVQINIDSPIDKEHYFKIGYFSSSYNERGINTILGDLGVPGLYDIFEPNDEYCFQPDWGSALQRCNQSIDLLEKKENYRCFSITPNMFEQPKCDSEKQAFEIFFTELDIKNSSFTRYSNNKGHFYPQNPLKIYALIPGTKNDFLKNEPCTYVITEGDNNYYLTALKIVKETIEYVLNQSDKEKYYLHWSS